MRTNLLPFTLILLATALPVHAQTQPAPPNTTRDRALATMKRATNYMTTTVSTHGAYVWSYLPDLSRRWGEMEASPTMMWIQSGTPSIGQLFLDAYHATGDEFYYDAACKTADALIAAQPTGGWNYIHDFAGEDALKKWYDTIGKNGWRLEEFQHYYGNATFDDSTTVDAARFMLRISLEKKDPRYIASRNRAIQFVVSSQHKSGGWPQRYPPPEKENTFQKDGLADYTSYLTLNDDVAIGNINFLILCLQTLGDKKLLEPIYRGMYAFILLQQPKPYAGWALQYTPDDLKPAAARSYEPKALVTHTTGSAIGHMLTFYNYTGDKQFLERIPEALDWLDSAALPPGTPGARGSHPTFVDVDTHKPLYLHRTGSNVISGHYFVDANPQNTIGHYSSFRSVNTTQLRQRYTQAAATPPEQATRNSPLRTDAPRTELPRFNSGSGAGSARGATPETRVLQLITSLNANGYWLSPIRETSNPYKGEAPKEPTPGNFASTNVGDQYDTSPFPGPAVQGITIQTYIANMSTLLRYVDSAK